MLCRLKSHLRGKRQLVQIDIVAEEWKRQVITAFLFSVGTPPKVVMLVAIPWQPRQPSSEGTNATDQVSTATAARTPGPTKEMARHGYVKQVFLSFLISLCRGCWR